MIDDHDTPIAVLFQQPLPRAGRQDPSAASNDYPANIPTPDLLRLNLSASELGAFAWMAERQKHRHPVTTNLLAEWMRDQLWRRWGEDKFFGGEAAQIVHQLESIGAVKAEPAQEERLAAAREDWDTLYAVMFGTRDKAPAPDPNAARQKRESKRSAVTQPPVAVPAPRTDLHKPDEDGHWRGAWPLTQGGTYPPKGQNVVYLLRAANDLVVYVGSTNHFRARMKAHQGVGKRWSTWTAIPCETRDEAYDVESEYLATHMPHLNVAGPRGSAEQ